MSVLDLDLKHYSKDKKIVLEHLYHHLSCQSEADRKPQGFWLSINESWKEFWENEANYCDSPDWLEILRYRHDISLDIDANILLVDTTSKMLLFNQNYGINRRGYNMINWKNLMYDYQGIIITPYYTKFRLEINFDWYYTWDCASGVIWDVSCIKSVDNVQEQRLNINGKPYTFKPEKHDT